MLSINSTKVKVNLTKNGYIINVSINLIFNL